VPLFKDRPTFPPLRRPASRRVLIILAPTEADVPFTKAIGRRLLRLGVQVVAASECHGEVRGERREAFFPNLLLIEAAKQEWDGVIVAGGDGARRVAEDPLAREVIQSVAAHGKPIAASGLGRTVLDRAGVSGSLADDAAQVESAPWRGLDLKPSW
jgi:hypothetical protein